MTDGLDDKHQRLLEAQLIKPDTEVPQEYKAVIDSLTPDELETLVSVSKRLNEAGRVADVDPGEIFFAP
jgi:hypothetical protein